MRVWSHILLRSFRGPQAVRRWRAFATYRLHVRKATAYARWHFLKRLVRIWIAVTRAMRDMESYADGRVVEYVHNVARLAMTQWLTWIVARRRRKQLIALAIRCLQQRHGVREWKKFCIHNKRWRTLHEAQKNVVRAHSQRMAIRRLERNVYERRTRFESTMKAREFARNRLTIVGFRSWSHVTQSMLTRLVERRARFFHAWLHLWAAQAWQKRRIARTNFKLWQRYVCASVQYTAERHQLMIREFQRRELARWIKYWKRFISVIKTGDLVERQHEIRRRRWCFNAWRARGQQYQQGLRLRVQHFIELRSTIFSAWAQWADKKQNLFVTLLHVRALSRTRLMQRTTARWNRSWKMICLERARAEHDARWLLSTAFDVWQVHARGKIRKEEQRRKALGARHAFLLRRFFSQMITGVTKARALRCDLFYRIQHQNECAHLSRVFYSWMQSRPALRHNFTIPRQKYQSFLLLRAFGAMLYYRRRRLRIHLLAQRLRHQSDGRHKAWALRTFHAFVHTRLQQRTSKKARFRGCELAVRHVRARQALRKLATLAQSVQLIRLNRLLAYSFQQKYILKRIWSAWVAQVAVRRQIRKQQQWSLHTGLFHGQKLRWFHHWKNCVSISRWERTFDRAAMVMWYAHTLSRSFGGWSSYVTRRRHKKCRQRKAMEMWKTRELGMLVPRLFRRLVEVEDEKRQQRRLEFELRWFRQYHLSIVVWNQWRKLLTTRQSSALHTIAPFQSPFLPTVIE